MNTFLAILPTVTLMLADAGLPDDAANVQGTWNVTSVEREGTPLPSSAVKKLQMIFKDGTLTIMTDKDNSNARVEKAKIVLHPSAKPKSLEMTSDDKDKPTVRGIYDLDGDTLKMCWRTNGGARPAQFTTMPQSGLVLFVLNRVKKD
jgi:uncharacterized protein (TIGR03067 family)